MSYTPAPSRYDAMGYPHSGKSGLRLPLLTLGLWHNFGENCDYANMTALCTTAFDLGVTHFDLANNYGPPYGSAETSFGRILKDTLGPYRDELCISTKAGYDMWPGPYGNFGSKKYLTASLDQSLRRMGLEYVDIFYHHRPDPDTPLEETMDALLCAVRSGKALYAGISNYGRERSAQALSIAERIGLPLIINQRRYSILDRSIEQDGLLDWAKDNGMGIICFSPLAQGMLSTKYLHGIPADSRAAADGRYLRTEMIRPEKRTSIAALNEIAQARGETLPQMALAWLLNRPAVTSVLIGASRPEQIRENVQGVLSAKPFTQEELDAIDAISPGPKN